MKVILLFSSIRPQCIIPIDYIHSTESNILNSTNINLAYYCFFSILSSVLLLGIKLSTLVKNIKDADRTSKQ